MQKSTPSSKARRRTKPAKASSTTATPKPKRKPKPISALPAESNMVRLNKFLSIAGIASRRKADEMIENGEVEVNGKLITELGYKIDRTKDKVIAAGRKATENHKKIYILLNKPKDAISTSSDELDRRTVMDLIGLDERVYTIGRLDRNTTGALLLTNDGELAHRLMHPSFGADKEYLAELDKKFSRADLTKLKGGLRLSDTGEKTSECDAEIVGDGYNVWLKIHEGKNRQIHRMFWTLGYDVKKLDRVSYAGITVKGLRRGEWRFLATKEIDKLRKIASMKEDTSSIVIKN